MTDKLKAELSFVGVAIGASATLPHGLACAGRHLKPDEVKLQFPGSFEVVSTDTSNITIRNVSNTGGGCIALLESWHPIERQFGLVPDDGSFGEHLTPQPFTPGPVAGQGGAAFANPVVFKPGGVATKNVVTTWADAMAMINQLEGPRVLHFDDSIVSPIVIPPGGPYDMTDVSWNGGPDKSQPVVHIPEGATFIGLRQFNFQIMVVFTGTTPPVSDFDTSGPGPDTIILDHGATITTSGAGPFFQVNTAGAGGVIIALRVGAVFATGTHAIINAAVAGAQLGVVMIDGGSALQTDTLAGVAGTGCFILVIDSGATTSEQQTAFLGSLAFQNGTKVRRYPTDIVTGTTVLTETEQLVQIDPTGGAFSVTLPAAFNARGQSVLLKNVTSSLNNVTVDARAGDNIDGNPSVVLSADHFFFQVTSDGVNTWWVTAA